ncbi:transposase [Streptomyces werraensis]|uniref:transposase n=1 Tax=Streptomyces werraensis TaxID=68284 RepID=UPI00382C60E8
MAAPRKYSLELRERAVWMYRTSDPKPHIKKLAVDLGVRPEALRKENAQLKRANDVLRTASAFFAAQLDPTRPR